MNAETLAAQISDAAAAARPGESVVQVTLFYGDTASEETGGWVIDRAAVTTHAPGGYVARGGDHYDETHELDSDPAALAAAILERAAQWAYEHLAAPDA